MKKIWIIFALVVIIAAQVTFIYSFRSTSTHSSVTGTSAVVISKFKYAYMRASIYISPRQFDSSTLLVFPNGTQKEIQWNNTEPFYRFNLVLPRSGDFLGDHNVNTFYGSIYNFSSFVDEATLSLSRDQPIDVDIISNVDDNFLRWYSLQYTDDPEYIDIYWFKIQGDATIHVSGFGVGI